MFWMVMMIICSCFGAGIVVCWNCTAFVVPFQAVTVFGIAIVVFLLLLLSTASSRIGFAHVKHATITTDSIIAQRHRRGRKGVQAPDGGLQARVQVGLPRHQHVHGRRPRRRRQGSGRQRQAHGNGAAPVGGGHVQVVGCGGATGSALLDMRDPKLSLAS